MIYLITRHISSYQWLKKAISEPCIQMDHLNNPDIIYPGDIVIGNLPIRLISNICNRGARFIHLQIDICEPLRGQELTYNQLLRLKPRLVEYTASYVRNINTVTR